MRKLANFALFQVGWFACVLESVGGHTAGAVTAFILAAHFWFLSEQRAREAALVAAVVLLGSLVTCYHFGYHHEHHLYPAVPSWRLPAARRSALQR